MTLSNLNKIAEALQIDRKMLWDDSAWISKPYVKKEDKQIESVLAEPLNKYKSTEDTDRIAELFQEVQMLREQNRILTKALARLMDQQDKDDFNHKPN